MSGVSSQQSGVCGCFNGMTDILLYICVLLSAAILLCRFIHPVRRRKVAPSGECPCAESRPAGDDEERRTRALIGDEAFEMMSRRVDRILAMHADDRCVAVGLTSGGGSGEAVAALHALLPGDRLELCRNIESGFPMIDVYSSGFRVGRLLLGDAETVLTVMCRSKVTGVYVAEQNCYGDAPGLSLKIIVFFRPQEEEITAELSSPYPYRITIHDNGHGIILYQN